MLIGNLKIRDRRLMISGKTTFPAVRLYSGFQTEYHHYRRTLFSRFLPGDNAKSYCLQLSQFLRPIWMNSHSSVFLLAVEEGNKAFFFHLSKTNFAFFRNEKTFWRRHKVV